MWFADKLVDLVTGLGSSRDRTTTQSFGGITLITDAEIESMYRTDWLAKKIVDIIPQDMVRAGRQWQAPNADIGTIEDLEKSRAVSLWPRVHEALVKARLVGGAGIFIGIRDQAPNTELDPDLLDKGDLLYLNVLARTKLTYSEIERNPMSPWYGEPKMWVVQSGEGTTVNIHPSRIVRLVGSQLMMEPSGSGFAESILSAGARDGVWGDPILQAVYDAVKNALSVQQHVAGLVPDSRTDVIYVPGLGKILSDPVDSKKLTERFQYAKQIKSTFNMLLLEGNGQTGAGGRGETWQQRQMSFSELPETMQAFLEVAAGAADIPVTRLLGQSPGGQNSTGESDLRNYYDHIGALQTLKLDPAMAVLDKVIKRSALGKDAPAVFYKWAPLWTMNASEKAEIFAKKATGARSLIGSGKDIPLVNALALSEALVTDMTENGSLPGLETAVTKHGDLTTILSKEDLAPKPDPVPVVAPPSGAKPVADAAPRTLYVRRQLLNTSEFIKWASDQGLTHILPSDQLHVTVLYSKTPVDWMKMGADMWSGSNGRLSVPPGGPRVVERLGPTATVLLFASSMLSWRHREMIEAGATSDYDEYVAHVTISHAPQAAELDRISPFRGELRFGPEIFEEVNPDWKAEVL